MYKKSLIVVLACVLGLALSGCSTVDSSKEKQEGSFTWNREERIIITASGDRFVVGHEKFAKEIRKVFPRTSCWGSPSLLRLIGSENLKEIKSSHHTIFMIRPECLYDFENLEAEYPDLLPTSTEKLKSYLKTYGYPLLYFNSCDSTGMLRGVIIAKEVSPSSAEALIKNIQLDIPLQYENGELKRAEKRKAEKRVNFTWDYSERLIITFTVRPFTAGHEEFAEEIRKVYGTRFNAWGRLSLLNYAKNKARIEVIRSYNTIFTVRPEYLYDLEDLEAEYPDLLPTPAEKLKSYLKTYGYPLLYFSYDYTGVLRGVIIAKKVDTTLAKLLVEKPIPLDTSLQYKNGKLEKLEK